MLVIILAQNATKYTRTTVILGNIARNSAGNFSGSEGHSTICSSRAVFLPLESRDFEGGHRWLNAS